MWSRQQRADESVDAYITDIRNTARVVPVKDETLIGFAIIRSLRPEIRLHVLQSDANTLDAVIKASRVAEAALGAAKPSTELSELKDQITKLIERFDAKPMVALVNSPEPTRRVSFSPSSTRHSVMATARRQPTNNPVMDNADTSSDGSAGNYINASTPSDTIWDDDIGHR